MANDWDHTLTPSVYIVGYVSIHHPNRAILNVSYVLSTRAETRDISMARKKNPKASSGKGSPQKRGHTGQGVQKEMERAHQHHCRGELDEAARGYAEVLKADPEHAAALMLLGVISMERDQYQDAERLLKKAIELRPNDAQFLSNYGSLLKKSGRLSEAIEKCQAAIEIDPDYVEARINLGNAYYAGENYVDALLQYREASLRADRYEVYNGLGIILQRLGYVEAAEEAFVKAIKLAPERHDPYNNFADLLREQGKLQASVQAYNLASDLRPDMHQIRWNRAAAELAMGDLDNGYRDYDFGCLSGHRTPLDLDAPRWDGSESLVGKRVGIGLEQGLGDEITFGTCYPDIFQSCKELVITCDPRLKSAWERLLPTAECVPVTKSERATGAWKLPQSVTKPDVQIPAGSLPRYFRPSFKDFENAQPIFTPDPKLYEKWNQRVGELPEGLKVGVSWGSGKMSIRRSWSYIVPEEFAPLLQVPNATFINLQYSATTEDIDEMERLSGVSLHTWDDLDQYNDIEQVIALISNLDLVISVGNVSSRIASALGKESWRLEGASKFSLGQAYVPFFTNTPVWRFTDFSDRAAVIEDVRQALTRKIGDSGRS